MSEFEKTVRKALIDKDMKMPALADELGISLGYLYEILKSTRKAKDKRKEICAFLGINEV